jgi:HD-like signal output (HDOD) protein
MLLMPALKKRLEKESSVGHLPTLKGILNNLGAYTSNPKATINEIGEQISRDPSLSVRLLRISNSAYYSRSEPVVSIDEAVLFLGIDQIRMLSMTTRCVEMLSPQDKFGFQWNDFWRHCIATAYFSNMIGKFFKRPHQSPELDYIAGLLHDVGKLVIAMLSPETFGYIFTYARDHNQSFYETEQAHLDTNHASLGGWYLERQNLPPVVSEAVRCHHNWTSAVKDQEVAAIVNVSDFLARQSQVGCSGNMEIVRGTFAETPSWTFLMENLTLKEDIAILQEKLTEESNRLGLLVDSLLPQTKKPSSHSNSSDSTDLLSSS